MTSEPVAGSVPPEYDAHIEHLTELIEQATDDRALRRRIFDSIEVLAERSKCEWATCHVAWTTNPVPDNIASLFDD